MKNSVTSTSRIDARGDIGESSRDSNDILRAETSSRVGLTRTLSQISTSNPVEYKVYKRRFFGLAQLVLLNIIVSWGWITFAPISATAARYFDTTESIINWLSTAFQFAFVVATPATFYALAKYGPKTSIVTASCLLLAGNWVKYAGTKANVFPVTMVGQLLIGFGQPFVLAAPTTYSNVWFSPAGRTSATAVASLANPLGAALGQLISPFWATSPSEVPNCVLYTAIIASVACIPSFFIPAKPPTPPSASISTSAGGSDADSISKDIRILSHSPEFYLIFFAFSVLVGFFNAFSSLLNQFLEPYGFSEDEAGIAGALLIFVGLASAAVSSPLIDKYKFHLWYIRVSTPIISTMYLVFYFAPPTRSLGYVCFVCAVLGSASFGLVPVILEFLVEIHHPLGPEVGSSICWSGGQFLGGVFIIIMDSLKDGGSGSNGEPPGNMKRALIFQAVLAMAAFPLPLCLGLFGRKDRVRMRRWEAEKRGVVDEIEEQDEEDEDGRRNGEGS